MARNINYNILNFKKKHKKININNTPKIHNKKNSALVTLN